MTDTSHSWSQVVPLDTKTTCFLQYIPIEILLEIFEDYVCDKTGRVEHLMLVCKLWNYLVIHTPSLWTNISLVITSLFHGDRTPRFPFHRAIHLIEKSGYLPLDIDMDFSGVVFDEYCKTDEYEPFLELLHNNIHRWRTFYITLPTYWKLATRLCEFLNGSAPNLIEFGLKNFCCKQIRTTSFTDLSKLKVLVSDTGLIYREMISNCSLPSLESLDIDLRGFITGGKRPESRKWPSEISLTRSLRTLKIRCSEGKTAVVYPRILEGPLELPLLKKIEIYNVERIDCVRCELPALRTLVFDTTIKMKPEFVQTNPIEVIWEPTADAVFSPMPSDRVKRFLVKVIRQYTSARRFVFPLWTKRPLLDAMKALEVDRIYFSLSLDGVCIVERTGET